jgi:ABC-type nitrate/sulfonate/bicarbonate transport system substrate-binding protein
MRSTFTLSFLKLNFEPQGVADEESATIVLAGLLISVRAGRRQDIVIATSGVTLTNTPIWVGIAKKHFDDVGLNVQYIVMRSDLAVKGLISGDVDYMQSSSSVLRAAVAGAPVTTILGVYNRTFFDLVARPEIRSLNDLRGKPVGISRYGASTEYAVRFGLKANNIDPDKDVKLLAIGGGTDEARISALEAGVVSAAVLQVPANLIAHKLGHKTLAAGRLHGDAVCRFGHRQKTAKQPRRSQASGARDSEVAGFMTRNPAETKAIIQKNLRGMETSTVEYIYDLVVKHATRNGIASRKALENSLLGSPFEANR